MTLGRLAWRGLAFHWRSHAAVGAGVAVSTAVLVGALLVGDAVRGSLHRIALQRLGEVEHAVESGETMVRTELAGELAGDLGARVAPVLRLAGTASSDDGRLVVGQVQVLGVDARFWDLGRAPDPLVGGPGRAVVNRRLAAHLALQPGAELVLRVGRPDTMPGELPLTWSARQTVPFRVEVAAVADDDRLGRFSLDVSQLAPDTVFLPIDDLGRQADAAGRANLLLVAPGSQGAVPLPELERALRRRFSLADAGLSLRSTKAGALQLESGRVFLAPPAERAGLAASPAARGVLTYFVTSIESAGGRTPYSFVAAPGPPLAPPSLGDDEIVLTDWLARDLGAAVGDRIELTYLLPTSGTRLEERRTGLRVHSVTPLAGAADPDLAPHLPGLTDSDACGGWDPSFPVDLRRVRPADEAYWQAYRTAPKAFVTLATARRLWGTRFGEATAVRFPGGERPDHLAAAITAGLDPATLGVRCRPVRQEGLTAAAGGVDFGLLFLGLSAFLLAAALVLGVLLHALAVARRRLEWDALLALGFPARVVGRLVLLEGTGVAVGGILAGCAAAVGVARLTILALGSVWHDAVASTPLTFAVQPRTILVGAGVSLAMSVVAMALTARRLTRSSRPLLATPRPRHRRPLWPGALAAAGLVAALAVAWAGHGRDREGAIAAWAGGVLALGACLTGVAAVLAAASGSIPTSAARLGLRRVAHRPGRTLALAGVLASGVLVVVVVGVSRGRGPGDPAARGSGTGGFAFLAGTTLPVRHDLNDPAGRLALGLPERWPASVVPLRSRAGDDASCLNLNRVREPRVLGVDPASLHSRGAFSFSAWLSPPLAARGWLALDAELPDGAVPAVADASTIAWGLGSQLGEVVTIPDERGQALRLRLVGALDGSILQGSLVIGEAAFLRHFPSAAGYRALLVDAPEAARGEVEGALRQALRDHGVELRPTAAVLAEGRAVEDTYIAIFLALGGLGLALGTAGFAALAARELLQRQGELACLRAIGFPRRSLTLLVLGEHAGILVAGLASGAVAGVIAALPSVLGTTARFPAISLAWPLAAASVLGLGATAAVTRLAMRGDPVRGLRQE
jgi:hypothetical protein